MPFAWLAVSKHTQPFPSPGALPNPGIELRSPALQADYLPAQPQEQPFTHTSTSYLSSLSSSHHIDIVRFPLLRKLLLNQLPWKSCFCFSLNCNRRSLEEGWQPIPVFLSGEPQGQRSLVGHTVHGVTKSPAQLSTHTQTHIVLVELLNY